MSVLSKIKVRLTHPEAPSSRNMVITIHQFKQQKWATAEGLELLNLGEAFDTIDSSGDIKIEARGLDVEGKYIKPSIAKSITFSALAENNGPDDRYFKECECWAIKTQKDLDAAEARFKAHLSNPPSLWQKLLENGDATFKRDTERHVQIIKERNEMQERNLLRVQEAKTRFKESQQKWATEAGQLIISTITEARKKGQLSYNEIIDLIVSGGGVRDKSVDRVYEFWFKMMDNSIVILDRKRLTLFCSLPR